LTSCRFILNGLQNANEILGEEAFNTDEWRVIGEYVYDLEGGRHQAFLSPTRPTDALGSRVLPHERIEIEQSLKYSEEEKDRLWKLAGLTEMGRWSRGDEYGRSHSLMIHVPPKTRDQRPLGHASPDYPANRTKGGFLFPAEPAE
jgi:uncharacterized SAM-dependent methyltransferase